MYLHTAASCAPCSLAGVPVAVDVATDDEGVENFLGGIAVGSDRIRIKPINLH
jgi:hypothetical protein